VSEAGAGAGAGIDSGRRGFGGGARRREVPGGTESEGGRDGTSGGFADGSINGADGDAARADGAKGGVADSSINGADGDAARADGAGGRALVSAALEPGGGRLGVPTETTRWLGIFGGEGALTVPGGGTLAAAGGGSLATAVEAPPSPESLGLVVMRASAGTRRSGSDRLAELPSSPARAGGRRWSRGGRSRSRRPAAPAVAG